MPTVELLTTHTHRGAVYRPGALLAVADFTARWLITRGLARLPDDAPPYLNPPATEAPEPTPAPPPRKRRSAPESQETPQ